MIDGKVGWREARSPYTYADDGNHLVTSWLTPGTHRFTVNVLAKDGSRGSATTAARVVPAPLPPAALRGTWARTVTAAEAAAGGPSSPPGKWRITMDRVGWRFDLPGTHGALMDVAYVSAGVLEARSGIFTKLDQRGDEGNIWCDHLQPVRYRWTVEGDTLTLSLVGLSAAAAKAASGSARGHDHDQVTDHEGRADLAASSPGARAALLRTPRSAS